MSAIACLRVLVDCRRTAVPADRLGPLISKYSNIFLEVRWTLPRQSQQLSHFSYLLSHPASEQLDTIELAQLSQELQERLFRTGVEDAVKLVLFEGNAEAIAGFSAMSANDVHAAMEDSSRLPGGGRLRRIDPSGSLIDVAEQASDAQAAEFRFSLTIAGAQGVTTSRDRAGGAPASLSSSHARR